jgi:hypothetical protein
MRHEAESEVEVEKRKSCEVRAGEGTRVAANKTSINLDFSIVLTFAVSGVPSVILPSESDPSVKMGL